MRIYDNPPNSDALYLGDGEWMSWDDFGEDEDFDEVIEQPEASEAPFDPDPRLTEIFDRLLGTARDYHDLTGKHLQVYGDLGELHGAIKYGIRLHRNYAQGSDGRLGNDLIEIKTISPIKSTNIIELNLSRNFSKILIVKIDENFEIHSKLIGRKSLRKKQGKKRINWSAF
ncbi:hypothetical protein [Sphingopyxis sp. 550A]